MSIFYAPFGWILSWCYEIVGNYGWSLVLFTVLTRIIMIPLAISQQKGMAKQTRIQPKIKKIQQRYAGNQQKINEEMNALYQREGANPLGAGCLPLAIQFPIMIGLYGVIYRPLSYVLHLPKETVDMLTAAVQKITGEASGRAASAIELSVINHADEVIKALPNLGADVAEKLQNFDFTFLGINMAQTPDFKVLDLLWLIPILSGVTSLMTSALSYMRQRKTNPEMSKNPAMGCMSFGMPLFSVYIAFQFPAGIGIYWTMSNLFMFFQTLVIGHTHSPKNVLAKVMIEETIERRSMENNLKLVAGRKDD